MRIIECHGGIILSSSCLSLDLHRAIVKTHEHTFNRIPMNTLCVENNK